MRAKYNAVFVGIYLAVSLGSAIGGDSNPGAVLDHRLQTIAGSGALNCGSVALQESPNNANRCVRKATSAKRPFYVRYDLKSMDYWSAAGLAGNGSGEVYMVNFDTAGLNPNPASSASQLLDDGHSIIRPCPKPIRFHNAGALGRGLTCLRGWIPKSVN